MYLTCLEAGVQRHRQTILDRAVNNPGLVHGHVDRVVRCGGNDSDRALPTRSPVATVNLSKKVPKTGHGTKKLWVPDSCNSPAMCDAVRVVEHAARKLRRAELSWQGEVPRRLSERV